MIIMPKDKLFEIELIHLLDCEKTVNREFLDVNNSSSGIL